MKNFKDNALLFLKGVAMGGSDIVPGVSGGTIAFITGIYEKLLNSIKSFDIEFFKLIGKLRISEAWNHINGNFLVVLVSGIFLSLISLANVVSFLLANHPIQLWSFFFGLIIISAISVLREIKSYNFPVLLAGAAGALIAFFITMSAPTETPEDLWFIFITGAVAICAMILPGISGSFILLIFGKYEFIINALRDFNLPVIIVFAVGCVTGLLLFARLVSYFLNNFHDYTIALLAGFMLGALNKIWPWKATVHTFIDRHGVVKPLIERNISPFEYAKSGDPHLFEAILFMALGILIVVLIEKISLRKVSDK
jgi:putative membrane protein